MFVSIKKKPLSNSLRHVCLINKKSLWHGKCIKKLSFVSHVLSNNSTKKRYLRTKGTIPFGRRVRVTSHDNRFLGVPSLVLRLEYNPYRSCFLALILSGNGLLCYLNAVSGMLPGKLVGTYIRAYDSLTFFLSEGDRVSLNLVPDGCIISNIEKYSGLGSAYIRSAGTYGQMMHKNGRFAYIKLPTGSFIKLSISNQATLGANLNKFHNSVVLGKAGRAKWRGHKSIVRGVAMNPVDHPHGGGEGKKGKKPDPMTYWGKVFKWRKTSKTNEKRSNEK